MSISPQCHTLKHIIEALIDLSDDPTFADHIIATLALLTLNQLEPETIETVNTILSTDSNQNDKQIGESKR